MAEPQKPGNNEMPDFKKLNDRMIVDHSNDPVLVIKTNLDPKDATENNPYYQHKDNNHEDKEAFIDFFKE